MKNPSENQFPAWFPDEASCLSHLQTTRWNGIVISPFAPNSKVYYCTDGKYKCRETGKYFTAKTGTIFHNSRIGLQKWYTAIWIMAIEKTAITSVDMAKKLGITQKSAWYMMQRIREHFGLKKIKPPVRKKHTTTEANRPEGAIPDADKLKMVEWLNMLKK